MLSTTNVTSIHRHVYLYGPVPTAAEAAEELSQWDSEWNFKNETVILHINSPGGCSATTMSIIDRLKRVGNLYTVCEGDCMSAALFLFLLGQQRAAIPGSLFMAHSAIITSPQGAEDSVQNLHEYTSFVSNMSKELLEEFLYKTKAVSKKELDELIGGKQIYFSVKDAEERGIINTVVDDIPQR